MHVPPPPAHLRRFVPPWLLVLVAYLIVTLLILAPTLPTFHVAVPGGPVAQFDGWQNVWGVWWVSYALSQFTNPFVTQMLFYPDGVDLVGQTLAPSNGLLVLPITALFGPVAGYNAAVVLAFVLTGVGGYALAFACTRHHGAAFVGGAILTFGPFHMTKVWDGQLELIALQWIPFYVLFLLRTINPPMLARSRPAPMLGDLLATGIFLALIGYTSWYYFFFSALATPLIVLLWMPWRAGWLTLTYTLVRLLASGGIALGVLLPALLPVLRSALASTGPSSSMALIAARSANLLDFWLPSNLHPLWGDTIRTLGSTWHPNIAAWNVSIGYVPLLLALCALWWTPRSAWRWWVLVITAILFALGPTLNIGTWDTAVPMPHQLLDALPGASISHRPSHFIVIGMVALVPLVSLGLQQLMLRTATHQRTWIVAGLLLVCSLELLPPRWGIWAAEPHPYYATLAQEAQVLLVLPAEFEQVRALADQIEHQRPLLGGFVSRAPVYEPATAPGVRELWQPNAPLLQLLPTQPEQALAALNYYHVSHVVLDRTRSAPADTVALETLIARNAIPLTLVYTDEQLSVWQLPTSSPQGMAFFGAGWYPEERTDGRAWRWMQERGEILLLNPSDQAMPFALTLTLEGFQQPHELQIRLNAQLLAQQQVPAQPERHTQTLHMLVEPGLQRLNLHTLGETQLAPDGRLLSIVVTAIDLRCCPKE